METCKECSKYREKKCDKMIDKDGKTFTCPKFTGNYATVRIPLDKHDPTPRPIKAKYGLSAESLRKLLIKQGYKCAICDKKKRLHLDHNHDNQRARGYLCGTCNTLLSGFDRPIWREQAEEYLNNPPAEPFYDDPLYESQIKFG